MIFWRSFQSPTFCEKESMSILRQKLVETELCWTTSFILLAMEDRIIQGQSTLSLQETFLTTRVEGDSATAPLSSILLQFMQEYL